MKAPLIGSAIGLSVVAYLLTLSWNAEEEPPPSGPVVNGLQISLAADREQVKLGEFVKFTMTLTNTSDDPMRICLESADDLLFRMVDPEPGAHCLGNRPISPGRGGNPLSARFIQHVMMESEVVLPHCSLTKTSTALLESRGNTAVLCFGNDRPLRLEAPLGRQRFCAYFSQFDPRIASRPVRPHYLRGFRGNLTMCSEDRISGEVSIIIVSRRGGNYCWRIKPQDEQYWDGCAVSNDLFLDILH